MNLIAALALLATLSVSGFASNAKCPEKLEVLLALVQLDLPVGDCTTNLYHQNGKLALSGQSGNWYTHNGAQVYYAATGNIYFPDGSQAYYASSGNWYHANGKQAFYASSGNWYHANGKQAYYASSGNLYYENGKLAGKVNFATEYEMMKFVKLIPGLRFNELRFD